MLITDSLHAYAFILSIWYKKRLTMQEQVVAHPVTSTSWLRDLPIMPTQKQRLAHLQGDWTASELSVSFRQGIKNSAKIITDWDAYCIFLFIWDIDLIQLQEQFVVVFLNNRQQVIGWRVLNIGSMETCVIDIRLLVSLALHCMASYVILAHNHPSSILQASVNDKAAIFKIRKALRLIDVQLFDHLIISTEGYLSLNVENMM
jgi:DNA repair protein RadC